MSVKDESESNSPDETPVLSTLEAHSPHIVEATLRSVLDQDKFEDFFRLNCRRFERFRQRFCNSSGDKDFDLHMTVAHNEFLFLLQTCASQKLSEIGVSEEALVLATKYGNAKSDSVSGNLVRCIAEYCDFMCFGKLMEDKIKQYYCSHRPLQPVHAIRRHVRVLWDIENVCVGRNENAFECITKLQRFLEAQDMHGPGIDCRITAFFRPDSKSVGRNVVQDMDKCAVELVWVSGKREDADRKLSNRIAQEIQVLKPEDTSFVIITSDQDFRHHFLQLRNCGYYVLVIHNALPGKWMQSLEMNASLGYRWSDIMASYGVDRVSDGTPKSVPDKTNSALQCNTSNVIKLPLTMQNGNSTTQQDSTIVDAVVEKTKVPSDENMEW
eukprot:CAMPEP_0185019172 /NCGR_PEP_ID=MMETSP1103-20130426/1801_1 /TAXON_ID=36769 /ORGANISM="Paraphysomonas bandaiensis, Strain Caron Lab Isolate" /LENGTH=382 /DNA_ID=CAMNT_0027549349 /DNA_START=57 /DNA_END=1202 /DNA_ORIENTATION=+